MTRIALLALAETVPEDLQEDAARALRAVLSRLYPPGPDVLDVRDRSAVSTPIVWTVPPA